MLSHLIDTPPMRQPVGVLAGAKSDLLVVTTIERPQHTSFLDAIVTTNITVRGANISEHPPMEDNRP
jgi:hypothetical protein